jgi:hypothetical protein
MHNYELRVGMRFRFTGGEICRSRFVIAVHDNIGTVRDFDDSGYVWVSFDHRPWRRRWVTVPGGLIEELSLLDDLAAETAMMDPEAEEYQKTAGRDTN